MKRRIRKLLAACMMVICCMALLAGCGSTETGSTQGGGSTSSAPGAGATKLGVILVGTRDDYGYNQGLYNCCEQVGEDLGIEVLIKESVPEDSSAQAVMEQLIAEGCTMIYATSYGHREYAEEVAAVHPDVAFFVSNQTGQDMDNICCLTTNLWDAAYINGVCAGLMTKTNELGYIGSFQIPVVISSMNAFTLGAQSVNPDVTVHAVFTGSWDDVGLQTNAVNGMASQNIDVIAQYQDYTKTIIETCEANGIYCIGYHVDTSALAPSTFIIGSLDTFEKQEQVIKDTIDGKFEATIIRGGFADGMCANTECSDLVPDDVKAKVQEAVDKMSSGEFTSFTGPIYKKDGTLAFEEGVVATEAEVDGMDYFVKGIIGNDK